MSIGLLITVFAVFGAVALGVGGVMQFVMNQTSFERRRLHQAKLAATTGVLLGGQSLDPVESKIAKRLVEVAESERAAILVLGSRKGALPWRGVARSAAANAPCPVILVSDTPDGARPAGSAAFSTGSAGI